MTRGGTKGTYQTVVFHQPGKAADTIQEKLTEQAKREGEVYRIAFEKEKELTDREIHADRQLPETVTLTEEQQRQSRERVKALIREVNRKLGIKDFEDEGEKQKRVEGRKKLLRERLESWS